MSIMMQPSNRFEENYPISNLPASVQKCIGETIRKINSATKTDGKLGTNASTIMSGATDPPDYLLNFSKVIILVSF